MLTGSEKSSKSNKSDWSAYTEQVFHPVIFQILLPQFLAHATGPLPDGYLV